MTSHTFLKDVDLQTKNNLKNKNMPMVKFVDWQSKPSNPSIQRAMVRALKFVNDEVRQLEI